MNMISYWLFFISSVIIMISSLFVEAGPASSGWTIYPPSGAFTGYSWFWYGYDSMVDFYGYFIILFNGSLKLYSYCNQFKNKGMSMTRLPC
jgi:cytochrome c oxidase subunit 1